MKNLYRFLFGLHLFVGIGALFGGGACILNPQSPFGAPVELLKYSPFSNFLIPGIILFAIVGLGNVAAGVAVYFKSKYHGYISGVFNGALMIWIVVQVIMLRGIAAPHVIYFLFGLVGAVLSAIILFEKRQFPANIIIDFYKKANKEA
jgi:hypothetical protein